MNNHKKLLFIHDALPAEGISGMIVFLRHFKLLKGWDIEIVVPENAYNQDIADSYPANFHVTTFPLRKRFWLPFRESITTLVAIRLFFLRLLFKKIIIKKKPAVIISVLFHYYSVASSQIAKELDIPFIIFLHDRWDIKSLDFKIQNSRKKIGSEVLISASKIFSVTNELTTFYNKNVKFKSEVLFPIPNGSYNLKIDWNESFATQQTIIYAGTVENHHIALFEMLCKSMLPKNCKLIVVTQANEKIYRLAELYSNIEHILPFQKNEQVIDFINNEASVVLVNYGLTTDDNVYSQHSFPSKFIEFAHIGLPIICIAPQESPFYTFLHTNRWSLLFSENNIEKLSVYLINLYAKDFWNEMKKETIYISENYFNPINIQSQFEKSLTR